MFSKPGYAALAVVTETSRKKEKSWKTYMYLESTRKYPQNCEITNCGHMIVHPELGNHMEHLGETL